MKYLVKPEASPGVPCASVHNRNDEYLRIMGERFNEIVLDRIEALLSLSLPTIENMLRRDKIDNGLMDPVRVFVKSEPHKREKVETGRVRLIMSVSLIDKMIELMLSRHVCKGEIAKWTTIPSKPGIGFRPVDNQLVYDDVMNAGIPMAYTDVSGWDWGVKEWMIIDEAESLILLAENHSDHWNHLIRAKSYLDSQSVYQFSDGTLVHPIYRGIMNSGRQRTSRGNSWMRVRLSDLCGVEKIGAAGDDTYESVIEEPFKKYGSFGIRLKDYQIVDDWFEFCSHAYTAKGAYNVNLSKLLMNLLDNKFDNFLDYNMLILAVHDELSNHPEYSRVLALLEEVGFYEVEGPHYI